MSEANSALWNALEALLSGLAHELEGSLETDTEPDWETLVQDIDTASYLAKILGRRSR